LDQSPRVFVDRNSVISRQVLLASAIVFPSVEIDGHLFVDGAARSNVIVPGIGGSERPSPPLFGPGNIYPDRRRPVEPNHIVAR